MSERVGVVIPYFQRESGILTRALRSIAAQSDTSSLRVVVVDDASPVPAAGEIAGLRGTFPCDLQLIEQPNAGPGGARNRGIEALAGDVRYIAFLDSDDEWSVAHLARARFALKRGYDVFFGDLLHPGAEATAWRRAKTIRPDEHPVIEGLPGLHGYDGDMFDQILFHNVIGTPTVVYDQRKFPSTRFRAEYQNAGEDYLFWIDLTRAGARFAFSSHREATCGYGVNVWVSAGWGTDMHFLRLQNHMKYYKSVLRSLPLSPAQRRKLRTSVAEMRLAMARDVLHRVSHGKPLRLDWLKAQAALDPRTILEFPWHALRSILDRGRSTTGQ